MATYTEEELNDWIQHVYYQAVVRTLQHAGRDPFNDSCSPYIRELQRWMDIEVGKQVDPEVWWPMFSEDAITSLRWS